MVDPGVSDPGEVVPGAGVPFRRLPCRAVGVGSDSRVGTGSSGVSALWCPRADSCFRERSSVLAWCSDQPSRRARLPIRRSRNQCSEPLSRLRRAEPDIERFFGVHRASDQGITHATLSRKIPEVVVLRSVFFLVRYSHVAAVANWPYPGQYQDATSMLSIWRVLLSASNLPTTFTCLS